MHHQMPPFVSKTTKSAGSISQAIRCCHASQIPIRAILPYRQFDPTFAKTCAGFGRSTEHPWRIVTPADLIPAKTSADGPLKYASNQLTQIPCASEGGMGTASLRDATTTGALRSSRPEGRPCGPGRGSPRNLDRLNSTKVRRCGVRAIGSAGRMTDHVGRRPGPASRWRLGSQFPLLYFITYFLKCLVDFFVLPSGCR